MNNLWHLICRKVAMGFILFLACPVIVATDIIMGKNYSVNIAVAIHRLMDEGNPNESTD